MKSLTFLIFFVTLEVLARALPLENYDSTEIPLFEAAQYKEHLINLKCPEIQNNHEGVKISEIGGIVYQPSPAPPSQTTPSLPYEPPHVTLLPGQTPSLALPPITEERTSHQTLVATTQQTISYQRPGDIFSEHDKHVGKKIKREQYPDLPDKSTSETDTPDEVTPFGEDVDEVTNEESDNEDTSTNSTEECTAPLTEEWANYNWYQVLLDNGGPPGAYLPNGFTWNLTKVSNPCARPVQPVPPLKRKTTFGFTHSKFEKVYRTEQMQIMFPGTPHEFIDVTGQLVWAPTNSTRRYFHMKYRKDDTGLYFMLDNQRKCVFIGDEHALLDVRVDCEYIAPICECVNGKESCVAEVENLNPGLQAALVGGG